jgi:hypothetical protein
LRNSLRPPAFVFQHESRDFASIGLLLRLPDRTHDFGTEALDDFAT